MKKIIVIGVILFSFSSCYYDNQEELYPINPNDCKTANLTYDTDVKSIFDKSCAVSGCHIVGAQLPTLETYNDVKNNLNRVEIRALIEKSMPPTGPLNSCDQNKLTQWIADGAPEK